MKLQKLLVICAIVAAVIQPGREMAYAQSPSVTAKDFSELREQWVQELRSKQLDQILKQYAPDAVFLPPSTRIAGQAAIREHFKMIMATFNSDLSLHSLDAQQSGDLAYDSGDYQETPDPESTTTISPLPLPTSGITLSSVRGRLASSLCVIRTIEMVTSRG
jgi:ketosteroid isomerase-like protein